MRRPRRPLLAILALLALTFVGLATPRPAAAHPLGNFSLNSCWIEPSADGARFSFALGAPRPATAPDAAVIAAAPQSDWRAC